MTEKEKKSIIKIVILMVIQSAIIIGIIGCAEIEGFSLMVCWSVKAGEIFFLIVKPDGYRIFIQKLIDLNKDMNFYPQIRG